MTQSGGKGRWSSLLNNISQVARILCLLSQQDLCSLCESLLGHSFIMSWHILPRVSVCATFGVWRVGEKATRKHSDDFYWNDSRFIGRQQKGTCNWSTQRDPTQNKHIKEKCTQHYQKTPRQLSSVKPSVTVSSCLMTLSTLCIWRQVSENKERRRGWQNQLCNGQSLPVHSIWPAASLTVTVGKHSWFMILLVLDMAAWAMIHYVKECTNSLCLFFHWNNWQNHHLSLHYLLFTWWLTIRKDCLLIFTV